MCETLMELIFGMWVPYGEDKKPIDFCGIPRSLEVNKRKKMKFAERNSGEAHFWYVWVPLGE